MSTHTRTVKARVEFDRVAQNTYIAFYDRQVPIGRISRHNRYYYFYPEDLDGISVDTLKAITDKIEWLTARETF